jgi:hypothetical protein
MSKLLNDMLNLQILENICEGTSVEVNISALSKILHKHRNTIKSQVNALLEHKIINPPIYPFIWLYQEYPLLVVARSDLPRSHEIDSFLREDENIFAAFFVRDEAYNTLMIEYHKDIYTYGEWRKKIVEEHKIPPREARYPADVNFFSNRHIFKYQPHSPIHIMEESYNNGQELEINGFKISPLCFQILKRLMSGEGIQTNENLLSQKLNVHRKTIERRISTFLKERIVGRPACRFPKFFVPPTYCLVYCLVEVRNGFDQIVKAIKADYHIPMALEANVGKYNLLLFKVFPNVEDHFRWEEEYNKRFPNFLGAMKTIILSPQMTANIMQQKVSLGIIKKRMEMIHGQEIMETLGAPAVFINNN